ncbi:MAG: hypothetical protein SFV20_04895 [Sphingopyxis sp.]|nr:hypothetical protein [Sphingopyxis sp.]
MFDILAQLNPAAWTAIIILVALGFLGAVVIKLVMSGKAKSPKDLVQVARDRAAAAKATKEAHKMAEAAIAEPVTSSRLSRIGARSDEGDDFGEVVATEVEAEVETDVEAVPTPEAADPTPETFAHDAGTHAIEVTPFEPESVDAMLADHDVETVELAANSTEASVAPPETTPLPPRPVALDLAEPANHPQNWDALVAVVDALEVAMQGPWPEDRLLPVPRFEESAADPEAAARAASQRQSAIQLARTINGAAREQAQEIIAVVREFAHQEPFSAQDCAAVMGGLGAIEWMALIERGNVVEKRTLPLTCHDPEAPLWVHQAVAAIYAEAARRAA